MRNLYTLFFVIVAFCASAQGQTATAGDITCPRPELTVGDTTIWGKIWQKPDMSLMALWTSLPYFTDIVNVLNTSGSNVTVFGTDNDGVLKSLERAITYMDKMSRLHPEDDRLFNLLGSVRMGYAYYLNFMNDVDKAGLSDVHLITDVETLRSHHDRICNALTGFVHLWKNQLNPSDKFIAKLVAKMNYHLIKGTIMSGDIAMGSSTVSTMLTDSKFVNLGEGVGQKVHLMKYIKPSDQTVHIFVNAFMVPDKLLSPRVVEADVVCTNGVMHVLDTILGYPRDASKMLKIWKLNRGAKAIQVAGLQKQINAKAGITLFVPINAAFDKLAFGNMPLSSFISSETGMFSENAWVKKADIGALRSILPLHGVNGVYFSDDLKRLGGQCLNGFLNNSLCVGQVTSAPVGTVGVVSNLMIENAKVIVPNIPIKNGVMHIIDRLLVKPGTSISLSAQPSDEAVRGRGWRGYRHPSGFGYSPIRGPTGSWLGSRPSSGFLPRYGREAVRSGSYGTGGSLSGGYGYVPRHHQPEAVRGGQAGYGSGGYGSTMPQ